MYNNEIWKQTKYKGYLVSNYGRIKSLGDTENRYKRNIDKILLPSTKDNGYLFVTINGHHYYIHRIVAETFLPNPDNLPFVNHKNQYKKDNRVNNLEWCSEEYNSAYSIGRKVKQIDIKTKRIVVSFDSVNQAAKAINGNSSCILSCCKRIKYNTYKGYIWRFINDNDYSLPIKPVIVRINLKTKEETIYNSVSAAADANKLNTSAIYNCIYKKSKTCGGYGWIKR